MDPSAMMQMMMQDPELMQMMQRPGVMAKLQAMMQNPAAATQFMNDPEMGPILQRLQRAMMGGGMPSASSFPRAPAPSASSSSSSSSAVIEISSTSQFQQHLQSAGERLVVVDFYATWCGPCKAIAPAMQRMAQLYQGRAVFLKVDVDKVRDLAASKGIRAMPTFHFYKNGQLVEDFSGANEQRISQLVDRLAAPAQATEPTSPYQTFPLREEEMCLFKALKGDIVLQKTLEFNAKVPAESQMNPEEIQEFQTLVGFIENRANHHRSKLTDAQETLFFDKLLHWPSSFLPPLLNLLRLGTLHPDLVDRVVRRMNTKRGTNADPFHVLLIIVTRDVETSAINVQTVLRVLCNMVSRRSLCQVVLPRCDELLEAVMPCASSSNKALPLALASLLVNLAIVFRREAQDADGASAKIQTLSLISDMLQDENADAKLVFRSLVILGTLIYQDETTCSLAVSLDIPAQVSAMAQKHPQDTSVAAVCKDLNACFSSTA